MRSEILTYISGNRKVVDISYELPDGKKTKVHRKMEGNNGEGIKQAVQDLKDRGVKTIVLDVYRPNGSAKMFDRSFTIKNEVEDKLAPINSNQNFGSLPLFQSPPKQSLRKPIETKPMESWKDYALQTERDKVAKLEAETAKLKTENKILDTKVRDFEKEMIRKEHEVQSLAKSVESKSGLNGFVDKAVENPAMMNMLAGIASRLMGIPGEPMNGGQPMLLQPGESQEHSNSKVDQYITNIKTWLYKQPEQVQDHFYELVYQLTNSKDVTGAMQKFTNLLRKPTPARLEDEVKLGYQ